LLFGFLVNTPQLKSNTGKKTTKLYINAFFIAEAAIFKAKGFPA
jgi:hypothetical protein